MVAKNFNGDGSNKGTEPQNGPTKEPTYVVQQHPLHKRGFQIVRTEKEAAPVPVGEYIVLDKNEPAQITQKKVALIQKFLNSTEDRKKQFSGKRQHVAFQRLGVKSEEDAPEQILFYTITKGQNGEKTYKENGLLTFSKEEVSKWTQMSRQS